MAEWFVADLMDPSEVPCKPLACLATRSGEETSQTRNDLGLGFPTMFYSHEMAIRRRTVANPADSRNCSCEEECQCQLNTTWRGSLPSRGLHSFTSCSSLELVAAFSGFSSLADNTIRPQLSLNSHHILCSVAAGGRLDWSLRNANSED